jgi:hypothetical protein
MPLLAGWMAVPHVGEGKDRVGLACEIKDGAALFSGYSGSTRVSLRDLNGLRGCQGRVSGFNELAGGCKAVKPPRAHVLDTRRHYHHPQ